MQLIDPITGDAAVEQVYQTAKIYKTAPPDVLPDLFVKWKSSAHFKEILQHSHAPIRQKRPQFYRPNNHTGYGFFSACGPIIQKEGHVSDAVLTDFAPVFRAHLGL
jgi:predicted AlkP superfamily phosphohydrolase/phosphomutase